MGSLVWGLRVGKVRVIILFRAVGRIFRQVGDVVESGGSVKNARGELVTDEGGIGEVWSCCCFE